MEHGYLSCKMDNTLRLSDQYIFISKEALENQHQDTQDLVLFLYQILSKN